jgi:hypothetical protein
VTVTRGRRVVTFKLFAEREYFDGRKVAVTLVRALRIFAQTSRFASRVGVNLAAHRTEF